MLKINRSTTVYFDQFVNSQYEYGISTKFPSLDTLVEGNVPRWKAINILHDGLLTKLNGLTLCSSGDLATITIKLIDRANDTKFEEVPLTDMLRSSNGGYYYELADLDLDVYKCLITLQDGNRTIGEIVAMEVIYDYSAN